jgi:2-polyprenyl-6-methoxyphenol hydroxylase-like FAD-dependent oxidoreductase
MDFRDTVGPESEALMGQTRFDVCIRGEGPVGRALALALSRQGLRVALCGLAPVQPPGPAATVSTDVRAYALNAASVALLRGLKVWDALPVDARTPVHDMRVEGDEADAALHFSAWEQTVDELAWIVDAAELDLALARAVDFSPHVEREALEVPAALRVLAEGKDSSARDALGVRSQRHDYLHSGVAARLEGDVGHAHTARQWFRSPEVLALLPFDRPQPQRSWGLVWSVPAARADELLALPDEAFEAALAQATGGAAGALRLRSPRVAWPLRLAQAERLCGPGWVLVGDAAHVVHPLAGQGLNLGLADVVSLAGVLAARESWRSPGDEALLRRHVRQRHLPTRAMAGLTDGLWHLFASQAAPARLLRNRGLWLLERATPLKKALVAQAFGGRDAPRGRA